MADLKTLLLHEKPAKILLSLKRGNTPKYASILSREANCTYSHTVKILNTFQETGLIEFKKEGRKKLIQLTDLGQQITASLESLVTDIEHINESSN